MQFDLMVDFCTRCTSTSVHALNGYRHDGVRVRVRVKLAIYGEARKWICSMSDMLNGGQGKKVIGQTQKNVLEKKKWLKEKNQISSCKSYFCLSQNWKKVSSKLLTQISSCKICLIIIGSKWGRAQYKGKVKTNLQGSLTPEHNAWPRTSGSG